jgi:hypothetical protein
MISDGRPALGDWARGFKSRRPDQFSPHPGTDIVPFARHRARQSGQRMAHIVGRVFFRVAPSSSQRRATGMDARLFGMRNRGLDELSAFDKLIQHDV